MTESAVLPDDPTTAPFWEGALLHELRIQRCVSCGQHQFYPRPFCLRCDGVLEWVRASGAARVYSVTTVRLPVEPEMPPPYVVAIVELEEGPRMLTQLMHATSTIGDRVRLTWREREGAAPLPVFEPA